MEAKSSDELENGIRSLASPHESIYLCMYGVRAGLRVGPRAAADAETWALGDGKAGKITLFKGHPLTHQDRRPRPFTVIPGPVLSTY